MNLDDEVNQAYDYHEIRINSKDSDRDYLVAAGLATAAVIADAFTTYVPITQYPEFIGEGLNQMLWSTADYIRKIEAGPGLFVESLLTMGVAILASYGFNKIMRGDWKPGVRAKKIINKVFKRDFKVLDEIYVPETLKKDWGTPALKAIALTSIVGCINNLHLYYQYFGIIPLR